MLINDFPVRNASILSSPTRHRLTSREGLGGQRKVSGAIQILFRTIRYSYNGSSLRSSHSVCGHARSTSTNLSTIVGSLVDNYFRCLVFLEQVSPR